MNTTIHTWVKVFGAAIVGGIAGAVILPMSSGWICQQAFRHLTKPGTDTFQGPNNLWVVWIGLRSEIPTITRFCNFWLGTFLGAVTLCSFVLYRQQNFHTGTQIVKIGGWLVIALALLAILLVGSEFSAEGRDPMGVVFVIALPIIWAGLLLLTNLWLSSQRKKSTTAQPGAPADASGSAALHLRRG